MILHPENYRLSSPACLAQPPDNDILWAEEKADSAEAKNTIHHILRHTLKWSDEFVDSCNWTNSCTWEMGSAVNWDQADMKYRTFEYGFNERR